jgi:hypothetical protein
MYLFVFAHSLHTGVVELLRAGCKDKFGHDGIKEVTWTQWLMRIEHEMVK